METNKPSLFKQYPSLQGKVPWLSLLTNVPTSIDRLTHLENYFQMKDGCIYIKRDDKDHEIYGGNKLRKFEFIIADVIKKKKKGVMTFGGVGTNHGLACAIVAKELGLKCDLYLTKQPLTWHVQRSLLLFNYFGAKLHYSKGYGALALKGLLFRLFHPKYYLMLPGGSPLLGKGNSLGTVGFINALFELKSQIDEGLMPEPDIIYVAGGSTGTAAGLTAGCKLLGLKTKVHIVAVSDEMFVNEKSIIRNCNMAINYLRKHDPSIPDIQVDKNDFKIISGYLGTEYGVKTKRGQMAVDKVMELEGKQKGFKLETTYTGKAMAGLFDYLNDEQNKSKKVLFWNTYNSNDLDPLVRETGYNWKKLPKQLHGFYKDKIFQCWQITNCPIDVRENCPAFLNHEYRFWKITECSLEEERKNKAIEEIKRVSHLEDA